MIPVSAPSERALHLTVVTSDSKLVSGPHLHVLQGNLKSIVSPAAPSQGSSIGGSLKQQQQAAALQLSRNIDSRRSTGWQTASQTSTGSFGANDPEGSIAASEADDLPSEAVNNSMASYAASDVGSDMASDTMSLAPPWQHGVAGGAPGRGGSAGSNAASSPGIAVHSSPVAVGLAMGSRSGSAGGASASGSRSSSAGGASASGSRRGSGRSRETQAQAAVPPAAGSGRRSGTRDAAARPTASRTASRASSSSAASRPTSTASRVSSGRTPIAATGDQQVAGVVRRQQADDTLLNGDAHAPAQPISSVASLSSWATGEDSRSATADMKALAAAAGAEAMAAELDSDMDAAAAAADAQPLAAELDADVAAAAADAAPVAHAFGATSAATASPSADPDAAPKEAAGCNTDADADTGCSISADDIAFLAALLDAAPFEAGDLSISLQIEAAAAAADVQQQPAGERLSVTGTRLSADGTSASADDSAGSSAPGFPDNERLLWGDDGSGAGEVLHKEAAAAQYETSQRGWEVQQPPPEEGLPLAAFDDMAALPPLPMGDHIILAAAAATAEQLPSASRRASSHALESDFATCCLSEALCMRSVIPVLGLNEPH